MRKAYLVLGCIALVLITKPYETEARDKSDARIIAAVSTWTQLSFVMFTTSPFKTCHLTGQTDPCRRRKLKKFRPNLPSANNSADEVMSSLTDTNKMSSDKPSTGVDTNDADRKGKLAVTIWSSVTSTYTMTVTVVDTATTYSLSFACSVVGANMPAAC